jgi:hypothetical protein
MQYMSLLPVPLFLKVWGRAASERGGHEKKEKNVDKSEKICESCIFTVYYCM